MALRCVVSKIRSCIPTLSVGYILIEGHIVRSLAFPYVSLLAFILAMASPSKRKKVFKKIIPLIMLHALANIAFADDILTCVNKECITKSDVMKVAKMQYGAKEYEALDESVKKKILKGLQDKLLVIDAAKSAKLEESAEYKEALENASKAILSNLYLKQIKEQITVEPNEISAYYQKQKDMYYTRVHTRTIVNSSEEKIKTFIEELQKVKPDERKAAFIKLVKKYSQHPTRHKEGDLGFIGYNSMAQPFGKEAFRLKDNEMTELPVKTTLGYHIIYVEERKVRSLEELKAKIENTLGEMKYRETFKDRLKSLRDNADITVK